MTKKRVEIYWDDAATSRYDPGLVRRRSVGWLVREGRKALVIAGTKDGRRTYEDFLTVPRKNVRRVRRLK